MKEINKTIPINVFKILETLQSNNHTAYLVGGYVRDMIMKIEPKDWDICTSATPKEIKEIFKINNIKTFDSGIKHGTITAILDDEHYEITTYRKETGYSDGRHPDKVEFVRDIHEDLKRRDFTINAIAYNPLNEEIIDDFNGQLDIKNGVIRAVGNPSKRFEEDSLRILRALRFAIKYQFNIDRETSLSIHKQKGLLVNISRERITEEIKNILTSEKSVKNILEEYRDIVGILIPDMIKCFDFNQKNKLHTRDVYGHILNVVDNCKTSKFEIKLAALLHDIGKPKSYTEDENGQAHFYGHHKVSHEMAQVILKETFSLTTESLDRILSLVLHHDMELKCEKNAVKRALNKYGEEFLNDWFILKQADMDDHVYSDKNSKLIVNINGIKEIIQQIKEENSCFSLKDLDINGRGLINKLGLKPGKHIGIILNTLLEEVIDEAIENKQSKLLERAVELNNIITNCR